MIKKNKNDLKILLISINNTKFFSNLGLDQIAGYLREKGYNIDIFYSHEGILYENVIKSLKLEYDIYGLSVNSLNYKCCLKLQII
jgi:hypothetical protein